MKIIIACEYSGTVRDAFAKKGHDVTSCDLIASEKPGKHIIIRDDSHLKEVLYSGEFDMMIGHPPCLRQCNSGVLRLYRNGKKSGGIDPEKWQAMLNGAKFFKMVMDAPIKKKAIENPIPHGYALNEIKRKYNQIIQPYNFGHPETKATCLWLFNLPKLKETKIADFKNYRCRCGNIFPAELGKYGCCETPALIRWDNQTPSGNNKLGKGKGKERAKTYEGIAEAMATQWGKLI
jgi:hypothetical protein